MVDLPKSLRAMSEQTLKEFVRHIGGNTKRDVEVKYSSTLTNFKLTVAQDRVIFAWDVSVGIDDSIEIHTLLLDFWNYHCRNALMALLQLNPKNNEIKREIDKIDAYVAHKQGSEFYEKGDYDKAIEFSHKAISLYPYDSMFYNNLGNAFAMKEKYDNAVKHLKLALRI